MAPNGVSWPTLVSQDPLFKDVDIYVYGYQSVWNRAGLTVPQLADEMNLRLEDAGIVERYERLIFVCHSMGGLVTRAFLARYRERTRDKVRFVYFFATPSSGSDFATLARAFLPTSGQWLPCSRVRFRQSRIRARS
jgi:pimeloyl-ACP methyl ester carboxylesterase